MSSSFHDGRLTAGNEPGFEWRIGIIAGAIVVAFLIFALRLFQLQIVEGADLRSRSERNFVRTVRLESPRGDMLDREGRVLATNRPSYRVQAIPNELGDGELVYSVLSRTLQRDEEALRDKIGTPSRRARFQPIVLGRDLPFEKFAEIETHRYAMPGVVTDIRPLRDYTEARTAAHLLGSIGEIASHQLESPDYEGYRLGETVGVSGLEVELESHMRGNEGGRNVVVDVAGREIETLDQVAPIPGGRVVLTIDLDLQQAAEAGFISQDPEVPDKMGAAIAMDPRNGEVLAMVSMPAYDPNAFAGGIATNDWNELISDPWKPLRNRAVSGQYAPGSTYKPIVAAAGLSLKEITPEEEIYCPGHYRLGRRIYRCWKRGGHGDVDMKKALAGSCDVYFYQLGVRLGIDRIAQFAKSFGLGRRTGISIAGENPGLVPSREWKKRAKGVDWIKGETVSASIGQGYNLVTPLQLASAYSAIANGGTLYKPSLVKRLETWDQEIVQEIAPSPGVKIPVSNEVLEIVRDGLREVVQGQGATGARGRVKGIEVAGKTGTTQVVSLDLIKDLEPEDVPLRYRDHALFVAFAPFEDPEIAVAVLVEHAGAGGGSVAAPIAQRVMARYFEKQAARLEVANPDDAPAGAPSENERLRHPENLNPETPAADPSDSSTARVDPSSVREAEIQSMARAVRSSR